jgi:hypothetical protein
MPHKIDMGNIRMMLIEFLTVVKSILFFLAGP